MLHLAVLRLIPIFMALGSFLLPALLSVIRLMLWSFLAWRQSTNHRKH